MEQFTKKIQEEEKEREEIRRENEVMRMEKTEKEMEWTKRSHILSIFLSFVWLWDCFSNFEEKKVEKGRKKKEYIPRT